jgi:oxygen-independent coproporphyrinogen-3 oxidase
MKTENSLVSDQYSNAANAPGLLSEVRVEELLRRYDRAGPRYTSYPSATQFRTRGQQDYLEALALSPAEAPLSLYIHIPFCSTPCYYCGCNKQITRNRDAVRQYLDHLRKEMALLRLQSEAHRRPVTQFHLGGGTPTFLDDAELTELVHLVSHYFHLQRDKDRDYAIEIDPRTVDSARIELIRGLGFNRISLGIQDFNPDVQHAINRLQPVSAIRELVENIRARAFNSLNFDLIYGLPLQSLDTVRQTLQQVITLAPDRISYYNYAHLPERFPAQRAIRVEDLPTPGDKLRMLAAIIDTLTAAGYLHIGMDHFVKPGDSLARAQSDGTLRRNFQGYTVNKALDLIGLGVSSISNVGKVFAQNAVRLDDYYQALDNNQLPVQRGLVSCAEDDLRRDIIQAISCYRYLDIADLERKHKICFAGHFRPLLPELGKLVRDHLIHYDEGKRIVVTHEGSLLLRTICMVFDDYLLREVSTQPVFSRVI